jgi:hypothetical protein
MTDNPAGPPTDLERLADELLERARWETSSRAGRTLLSVAHSHSTGH